MATAESSWDAAAGVLSTRLGGEVGTADVARWKESLARVVREMEDGARFGLLADLRGYEYADLAAHKEMRGVVPLLLAAHGFRTALLDLFDPVDLPLRRERDIACVAAAHVHHDAGKMGEYDARLGRAAERWFTDADEALRWLRSAVASAGARWELWRQDDGGVRYHMDTFTDPDAARRELARFEALQHKQIYWLEEKPAVAAAPSPAAPAARRD